MSKLTRSQGLQSLHQQSLRLLHSFATTTQDAARYDWSKSPNGKRVAELTRIIKRDLEEMKKRLDGIKSKHSAEITSAVLNNPNHPVLLKAGGDYYDFIEQTTATVSPHSGELMDLISDLVRSEKKTA